MTEQALLDRLGVVIERLEEAAEVADLIDLTDAKKEDDDAQKSAQDDLMTIREQVETALAASRALLLDLEIDIRRREDGADAEAAMA